MKDIEAKQAIRDQIQREIEEAHDVLEEPDIVVDERPLLSTIIINYLTEIDGYLAKGVLEECLWKLTRIRDLIKNPGQYIRDNLAMKKDHKEEVRRTLSELISKADRESHLTSSYLLSHAARAFVTEWVKQLTEETSNAN